MSSFDAARTSSTGPLTSQPFSQSPTARTSAWGSEAADPWGTGAHAPSAISTTSILSETVPPLYERVWATQTNAAVGGMVSLGTLQKVLATGGVKASAVEKIISLVVKDGATVSRDQFFVALCLLAFAQTFRPLSIEDVNAARDSLPIPTLPSFLSSAPIVVPTPIRSTSEGSIDPWNSGSRNGAVQPSFDSSPPLYGAHSNLGFSIIEDDEVANPFGANMPAGGLGYGEGEEWALGRQDSVEVVLREELGGWILQHNVWFVRCEKTASNVERRYSDFVWLLESLTRRYPFRLLPALPPKRLAISGNYLATDDLFLERRRRGLERFLRCLVNHPIFRVDGLVHTFLSEQSELSLWRKHTPYSLEEESASRVLSPAEEMSIPQDLDEKLAQLRHRILPLVDHWTRLASTFDRIVHRRQNQGGDLIRLKVALDATLETERSGWRPVEVTGVELSEERFSEGMGRAGEIVELSAVKALESTVEEIKRHRELYVHCRDLFSRQHSLSPDAVDRLKRRVEGNMRKLEVLREAKEPRRPTFDEDVDKVASAIEADQRTIDLLLRRRVFIKYCMWQEVLFLFRSTSLLTTAFKDYLRDEMTFNDQVKGNWERMALSLGA